MISDSYYRYTLTYTPSLDRILPSPHHLHVKIRNTSAIPLRAAYLVGPYTLYTACYPSTFDPNYKSEATDAHGVPEFEPNLKAGGGWTSLLTVPESIRETAGKANVRTNADGSTPSFTWIIEIAAQVIFSTSATVHFELLVGRDEKSIELGFAALSSSTVAAPGQLVDHQQGRRSKEKDGKPSAAQAKGVFSHAISLVVDDTASLWNKPPLPEWKSSAREVKEKTASIKSGHERRHSTGKGQGNAEGSGEASQSKKRKRIHLVVLTHGLHSNLGADMLYLKESIDAASRQAREDARRRKQKERTEKIPASTPVGKSADDEGSQCAKDEEASKATPVTEAASVTNEDANETDDDEEEVIVRGFGGNACRTERGIQYLGKRLAKYILQMTYPDQDFLPQKLSVRKKLSRVLTGDQPADPQPAQPQHHHSSIVHPTRKPQERAYKITSISFIAHSLGGLTQTYAIAYIHKHSPNFFDEIKPINFVTMAAPFLGLSNENPLYVKFALNFGLVGRTGQDLGLTWRAPTMVRSGWGAMIGGIGNEGQRARKQPDPGSKPLLRILPTGHTHQVLKKFRNRTVYSNVVNDGIVPLRTSCLLFLDWSGLGRVEKARRENGLIGTGLSWGWAELTGANASSRAHLRADNESEGWSQSDMSGDESSGVTKRREERAEVPQPAEDAVKDDNTAQEQSTDSNHLKPKPDDARLLRDEAQDASKTRESPSPMTSLLTFLRPNQAKKPQHHSPKQSKIYERSQTFNRQGDVDSPERQSSASSSATRDPSPASGRPGVVRGDSLLEDPSDSASLPPKTTIFESAGDVLNPPLPSQAFIIDPTSRPRTIFHDRVYHPEDIPPPPRKKPSVPRLARSLSSDRSPKTSESKQADSIPETSNMKVEEKIARAYHHGLSWRKVLVRLEPDAHNNLVVRRMFANAYGWPVIKHLVDTHFSDTYAANTADVHEPSEERAKPIHEAVGEHGEEVDVAANGTHALKIKRSASEAHEAQDSVADLQKAAGGSISMNSSFSSRKPTLSREDSAQWDDTLFEVSDSEDEDGGSHHHHDHQRRKPKVSTSVTDPDGSPTDPPGTSEGEINKLLGKIPAVESPQEITQGKDLVPAAAAPGSSAASVGLGKSVEERLHLDDQQNRATAGL